MTTRTSFCLMLCSVLLTPIEAWGLRFFPEYDMIFETALRTKRTVGLLLHIFFIFLHIPFIPPSYSYIFSYSFMSPSYFFILPHIFFILTCFMYFLWNTPKPENCKPPQPPSPLTRLAHRYRDELGIFPSPTTLIQRKLALLESFD